MHNDRRARFQPGLVLAFLALLTAIGGDLPWRSGCAPAVVVAASAKAAGSDAATDSGVRLTWLTDGPAGGRPLDAATRDRVASDYLGAWQAWNRAYGCDPSDLDQAFAASALGAVRAAVADGARHGWLVSQGDSSHVLQLRQVSSDGQTITLADQGARIARVILDATGSKVSAADTEETFNVVMAREAGRWRVRELSLQNASSAVESGPLPPPRTPPGFVGVRGRELVRDGQPLRISGFNYFPADSPWLDFWRTYDVAAIDRDLAWIEARGLNAIRILVPYQEFGAPTPNPVYLDRLGDLLRRARAHHLLVDLTLFDFRDNYDVGLWARGDRQLESLVRRFADDPTILCWDILNEPNLYYAAYGREMIEAWLAHTARLVRALDPHHLVTIGWFEPESASTLASLVDVVSFHHYRVDADLSQEYLALRAAVTDKPILLEEFGRTTWNALGPLGVFSEEDQDNYYRDVLGALERSDCVGYLAWTLHDFRRAPPVAMWPEPWKPEVERHFGVLRLDGSPKPVLQYLRPWH